MRRTLPDPDINLRDAADFIIDSTLGRKALSFAELPNFPVFLRDLVALIYRLTGSCQLPEYTDHGLPHLCSLVDRICRWTCVNGRRTSYVLDRLTLEEAAILLMAVLFHDIGMLSQRPEDLDEIQRKGKEKMDLPTWVRSTHVLRMERLVQRLFADVQEDFPLLESDQMRRAFMVARAHGDWPWNQGFSNLSNRDPALAAILAVADLLDEDSSRCDTVTLIRHRQGTPLNIAHWIRHCLTKERVQILKGKIVVRFLRPPSTDNQINYVFAALRNHYRLIQLYNDPLSLLGLDPLIVSFAPRTGIPNEICQDLSGWDQIPELQTQEALLFHLLDSFFALSLLDRVRESEENIRRLEFLNMEDIDLTMYHRTRGTLEKRSPSEQAFFALLMEDRDA